MNTNYKSLCEDIEAHLGNSLEDNAAKLLEKDALLATEMDAFEANLSPTQLPHWQEIRGLVDSLRQTAKVAKLRLMDGDEGLKNIIDQFRTNLENSKDEEQAAIEISREMHQYTGVGGVLKSLFMWKPSPEEKIEEQKS